MTPHEGDVSNVLRTVLDPEIGIDIVSLGLVYAIGVEDDRVHVVMTLTVPGCPMHATIAADALAAIRSLDWVRELEIRITFEPRWTPRTPQPRSAGCAQTLTTSTQLNAQYWKWPWLPRGRAVGIDCGGDAPLRVGCASAASPPA